MASALTTSPPSRSARSRARSDLPVAVGPTTATIGAASDSRSGATAHRTARGLALHDDGAQSADELVGVLADVVGAVVLVVTERVTVDAGVPGVAGLAPAVALDGLAGLLGLSVVEAVDVERAVEVVVLVLHAAGEPARRVELDPVPIDVEADDVRTVGTLEGEGLAGHGQTALGLLVGVRPLLRDPRGGERRVDDVTLLGHPVVVGHLPDEDAQADTDLWRREAHTVGCDVGLVHVLDEGAEIIVELRDEGCGPMEDGLAGDHDGAHAHAPSQARGVTSARIGSDDSAPRCRRCWGRLADRRHPQADARLAGALGDVLERCPGVAAPSPADGIRATLEARVGDEVVRRTIGHLDGDHVTRPRHLGALGHGEVDEPVVAGPSRQSLGLGVLAPLRRGDEDLDLTTLDGSVAGPADLLLEGDEPFEALLDDRLGDLVVHRRRGGAGADGVLEGEGAGEAGRADDLEGALEVLLRLAGEADDDVGRDRGVRDVAADGVDDAEELRAPVRAAHVLEHLVRA